MLRVFFFLLKESEEGQVYNLSMRRFRSLRLCLFRTLGLWPTVTVCCHIFFIFLMVLNCCAGYYAAFQADLEAALGVPPGSVAVSTVVALVRCHVPFLFLLLINKK